MNLFSSCNEDETHAIYQRQQVANLDRQLSFLKSIVNSAIAARQQYLSHSIVKHLNFHAITSLHDYAGEYRPSEVTVQTPQGSETYEPPKWHEVPGLMDDCINLTNGYLSPSGSHSPVQVSAWTLWSLNYIHPFVNGNGRTARAACYFVLCLKYQQWLPGLPILPSLIQQHHEEYVSLLKNVDATHDFESLVQFLNRLLRIQLQI